MSVDTHYIVSRSLSPVKSGEHSFGGCTNSTSILVSFLVDLPDFGQYEAFSQITQVIRCEHATKTPC